MERLNIHQIYDLLQDFYGHKCSMVHLDEGEKEIKFILYDSFHVGCDVNDRYGRFGAGISMGREDALITFLGKRRLLDSDKDSIIESFQIIDDYCRASLPDKFLKAYDEAYLPKQKKEGSFFVKIKKIFEK